MADSWIKMRVTLLGSPKVAQLAACAFRALDVRIPAHKHRTALVAGLLLRTWALADAHTEDGFMPGYTADALDDEVGVPGWSAALVEVGWLEVSEKGITFPEFLEHNGASTKRRSAETKRMQKTREKRTTGAQGVRSEAHAERTPSHSHSMSPSHSPSDSDSPSESERGTGGDPTPKSPRRAKHARCTLDEQLSELEFSTLRSDIVEAARAWAGYRREQGHKPWGASTWRSNLRQAVTHPEGFCAAVQFSIRQGYQGLFPPSHANGSAKPARPTASVANVLDAFRGAADLMGETQR